MGDTPSNFIHGEIADMHVREELLVPATPEYLRDGVARDLRSSGRITLVDLRLVFLVQQLAKRQRRDAADGLRQDQTDAADDLFGRVVDQHRMNGALVVAVSLPF